MLLNKLNNINTYFLFNYINSVHVNIDIYKLLMVWSTLLHVLINHEVLFKEIKKKQQCYSSECNKSSVFVLMVFHGPILDYCSIHFCCTGVNTHGLCTEIIYRIAGFFGGH